jgi:ribosomal protein L11 methylase PrmA
LRYCFCPHYENASFDHKKEIVRDLIERLNPEVIWDFGANTGVFSRLVQEIQGLSCSTIISSDIDPGAVELNYLECKKQGIKNVYPLILDMTNPSPAIGWNNSERKSFYQRGPADVIVALALIHHLAISNNVPLEDIARFFASLCKNLVIEFVPKEDSQVKQLLASREDIFSEYSMQGFCAAFAKFFTLEKQIAIQGTVRTIFLFSNRTEAGDRNARAL